MYGVYLEYDDYDETLCAICDSIIECKRLIYNKSQEYIKDKREYKRMFTEYGYSIQKLEKNKWIDEM